MLVLQIITLKIKKLNAFGIHYTLCKHMEVVLLSQITILNHKSFQDHAVFDSLAK